MSTETRLFKIHFNFSEKASKIVREIMIREYTKLRSIAVKKLNPHFDAWNSSYSGKRPTKDIHSEETMEYNNYIRSCEEPILEQINRENRTLLTELHADEFGDIIAVNKFRKSLTMYIDFEPVNI